MSEDVIQGVQEEHMELTGYISMEKYEALEDDYRLRMCDVAKLNVRCLQGRDFFFHESAIKGR